MPKMETQEQMEARWAAARERLNVEPPETRDQAIKRMEKSGLLDPDCKTCRAEAYARTDKMPYDVWMPSHRASSRCRSGGRNHCTCDTCF